MRTKIMTLTIAVGMLLSLASIATAHHRDGHDANNHGMCTAYFSGGENGQEKKRENGNAFEEFVDGIEDYDGDGDTDAYDVARFCNDATGGFGNPGQGNDPYFGDSDCPDDADDCESLENQEGGTTPGESNGNDKNKDGDGS